MYLTGTLNVLWQKVKCFWAKCRWFRFLMHFLFLLKLKFFSPAYYIFAQV